MPRRLCRYTGCPTPAGKGGLCDKHRKESRRRKAGRQRKRGVYSPLYQQSRRELMLDVAEGRVPERCALCGEGRRSDDPWTADHIRPTARGGGDERSNLQLAHRTCNSRKGAKQ